MNEHQNPSRKKVSFPLCGVGNPKSTPRHKNSRSFKNTHQLSRTKLSSQFLQCVEETERIIER